MDKWNEAAQPPKEALKQIKGGRLKGMTDINPQWRLKIMTEIYGPCGIGWKYEVANHWNDTLEKTGQVAVSVLVNLYIKDGDNWSDPIPGIGGNQLVASEKSGLYLNDEAYKMALTDALSVAMKAIGVGSAIYEGRWDGMKFDAAPENITGTQVEKINTLKKDCVDGDVIKDDADFKSRLKRLFGTEDFNTLNSNQADSLIKKLEAVLNGPTN